MGRFDLLEMGEQTNDSAGQNPVDRIRRPRCIIIWIFTKDGFVSLKQHDRQPRLLVVRGRVKGDIERLMGARQVVEDHEADYRFRAFLDRDKVADAIAEHVRAIRYEKFKSSITDKRRSGAYLDVWSRMDDLQWELSGEQQIARSKT